MTYSASVRGPLTPFRGDLTFGRNANPSWDLRFFAGDLTEIRLWNYARPDAEIEANKDITLPNPMNGLVGWWPLTEGSGATVPDHSGGGHAGAIRGAQWIPR
jgi:hypothetical protein